MASAPGGGSTSAKNQLEMDVDSLKSDLNKIKDDLRRLTENAMDRAQNRARSVKATAEGKYEEGRESIEEYIERRPMTSILVAFGVGVLVSKIFDSK